MFESSVLPVLQSDPELTSSITTFANLPAIFSDSAPKGAAMPYIVFRIERLGSNHLPIAQFVLYVDYWDYGTSKVKARKAAERIEFLLDRKVLEHERYSTIRVSFFSGGTVPDDDPKAIHYNQQFSIRASRKKWIDEITKR